MAITRNIRTDQYLTFRLGNELYAFDVGAAREIVDVSQVTKVPNTPNWIRGVFNLRGSVVPLLDLKQKLLEEPVEESEDTCVIVVESFVGDELFVVGILTDGVQEVFEFSSEKIDPPFRLGHKNSRRYLRGMGRRGEDLFMILDSERVFGSAEAELEEEVA